MSWLPWLRAAVLAVAVQGGTHLHFAQLALSLTPQSHPGADTWLMVQFRLPPGYFSDQYYHNLTLGVPSGYVLAPRCRMATLPDCGGRLVREDCVFDEVASEAVGVLGGYLDPAQTCSVIFGVRVPLYIDPSVASQTEWSVSLDGHSRPPADVHPFIRVMNAGLIPAVTGYALNPSIGSLLTEIRFSFVLTTPVEAATELTVLVPSGYEVLCDLGFRSDTLQCLQQPLLGFRAAAKAGSTHSVVITAQNPSAETSYSFDWGLEYTASNGAVYRGYFQTQHVVGHFGLSTPGDLTGSCSFTSATQPGSCSVEVTLQDVVESSDELYLLLPYGFAGVNGDSDLSLALTGKSLGDVVTHTFPNILRSPFPPPVISNFAVLHRKPPTALQVGSGGEYAVKRSGEFVGLSAAVVGTTSVVLTEEAGVQAAGVRGTLKLVIGSVAFGVKSGVISSDSLDLSDVISVFPVAMRSYLVFRNGIMELTWPLETSGADTAVEISLEGILFPQETGGDSVSVAVELSDESGTVLERGDSNTVPVARRMEIALGVDCSPVDLEAAELQCNAEKPYYEDEDNLVRASVTLVEGEGVVIGDELEVQTGTGFVIRSVTIADVSPENQGSVSISVSETVAKYEFSVAIRGGFVVEILVNNPVSLVSEDALKWYFRILRGAVHKYRFDVGWIPFSLIRGVQTVSLESLVTNDPLQLNTVKLTFALGRIGLPAADYVILQAPSGFVFPTNCLTAGQAASTGGVGPTGLEELYRGVLGASNANSASGASWVSGCVGDVNKGRLRLAVETLEAQTSYSVQIDVKNSDSERTNGYWRLTTYDRDDSVLYRHFAWIPKPLTVNVPQTQLLPETGRNSATEYMWMYLWIQLTMDTPKDSLVFLQTPSLTAAGSSVKVKCSGSGNFRVLSHVHTTCAGSDTLAVLAIQEDMYKGDVLLAGLRVAQAYTAASTANSKPYWKLRVTAPGGVLLTSTSDVQGWTSAEAGASGMDKLKIFASGKNNSTVTVTFQASKPVTSSTTANIRLRSPPGFTFGCGNFVLYAAEVQGFRDVALAQNGRTVTCMNAATTDAYNELILPVTGVVVADAYQGKLAFRLKVERPDVLSTAVPNVWTLETRTAAETVEFARLVILN